MKPVYFSSQLNAKFLNRLKEELKQQFPENSTIAIKIHFGEPGNKYAFVPQQIKPLTEILTKLKINFFLYDSSVAYGGRRGNAKEHKKWALEKGWGQLGEVRTNDTFIPVKMEHLTYEVSKDLAEADGVLVISHVKGHVCSGFGGAIKNLGMGALSKETKSAIHDGAKPVVLDNCNNCGLCVKACPIHGLKLINRKHVFELCYGCSDCIIHCPIHALKPKVAYFDTLLAEGAAAAQSQFKKHYYLSFLVNIAKECDCEAHPSKVIAPDTGYIFGPDGVALDQAAYDLITKTAGHDIFLHQNKKSGLKQVQAAEQLGMGNSNYELITL